MKKKHFDVGTDGFYGAYWKCKSDSDCAMIAMIGYRYLEQRNAMILRRRSVFSRSGA